jgi:hypothetical protein
MHKGEKYSCRECDYQSVTKSYITRHQKAFMKERNINVGNANSNQLQRIILLNIKRKNMKENNLPCSCYDYQATSKDSLSIHQKAVHEGRKYKCRDSDLTTRLIEKVNLKNTSIQNI